jgi:beta-lactamase superfamily II metal-dependent hydrolase
VCVQNPNTSPADVTISFYKASGGIEKKVASIPAKTRATFSANEVTGPEQDFAIRVESSKPVVAERPMYFDYQGKYVAPVKLTARFLNVGEADSCILKVENKSETFFALVDTGGIKGTSGQVVSELEGMGCSELNVMVLSHPDADHVGGATAVMNSIKVDQVWDPGVDGSNSNTWQTVKSTIAAKGIPRVHPHAGETFGWAGIQTEVLNPPAGASYSETNDYSIVLVESVGSEDIMLTGDSQASSQQYMMSESFPGIEVFKAPHHGGDSGCYQPFFAKVHPPYSVVSVGPNSYGHPSASVLGLLGSYGTVYRTDQNGNVTVVATANSLQVTADASPQPNPNPTPTPTAGPFVGSKNSNVYHWPSCSAAQKIKPENLVTFANAQEAVNAGYRPCKICNPPLP